MTPQNARRMVMTAVVPLALLGSIAGCKRHAPVGQLDDGIYEIRDLRDEPIGEIYAHHTANYGESYEYWAVDEKACPRASTTCDLGGSKFVYKGPIKTVEQWKADWEKSHSEDRSSFRFFRATYDNSTAGALDCSGGPCKLSSRGRATPISMFQPGSYRSSGESPAYIVVERTPGGVTETWFMDRFFNSDMPASGVSLSSVSGGMAPDAAKLCNNATVKVDVQYKECKSMPSSDRECAQ